MIPKIVHCCWFGGAPYPETIKKCLRSWEQHIPDYHVRIWKEHDIQTLIATVPWVQESYKARKWAFVADYVRLFAVFKYGGIYMDTDVMVHKNLDIFLKNSFFVPTEAYYLQAVPDDISPDVSFFGAIPRHPILKECLDFYDHRHFKMGYTKYDETPIQKVLIPVFQKYGYQRIDKEQMLLEEVHVYPTNVMSNSALKQYFPGIYTEHLVTHSWKDGGRFFTLLKNMHLGFLYPIYKKIKTGIKER